MIESHKTAIHRKRASKPARSFAIDGPLTDSNPHASVLDWGCGKGTDVNWFAKLGLLAVGYDPAFRPWYVFGTLVRTWYDYITCFYVLNVIPTKKGRIEVIRRAKSHLTTGGKIFIAVRPKKCVDYYASEWEKYRDGYITSRNTCSLGQGICWMHRYNRQMKLKTKTLVNKNALSFMSPLLADGRVICACTYSGLKDLYSNVEEKTK